MQVKTQLNTPHHAQLEAVVVEHNLLSFSHCLVAEKERVRCSSTLLFGISSSHFMIRVKAQMVTLLDGFFFRVDPNSFSEPIALSFSSPLARRENYTPDDSDLYHVLLGAHLPGICISESFGSGSDADL